MLKKQICWFWNC